MNLSDNSTQSHNKFRILLVQNKRIASNVAIHSRTFKNGTQQWPSCAVLTNKSSTGSEHAHRSWKHQAVSWSRNQSSSSYSSHLSNDHLLHGNNKNHSQLNAGWHRYLARSLHEPPAPRHIRSNIVQHRTDVCVQVQIRTLHRGHKKNRRPLAHHSPVPHPYWQYRRMRPDVIMGNI